MKGCFFWLTTLATGGLLGALLTLGVFGYAVEESVDSGGPTIEDVAPVPSSGSGTGVSGSIAVNESQAYTFSGLAKQCTTVSAEAFDGVTDPAIEIIAPSGETIAADDDSGLGTNALLENVVLAEDGEYTVILTANPGLVSGDSGGFSLEISTGPCFVE